MIKKILAPSRYGKSYSRKKQAESVAFLNPQNPEKSPLAQFDSPAEDEQKKSSYASLLDYDNSILMSFDLESVMPPPPVPNLLDQPKTPNSKKRKSDYAPEKQHKIPKTVSNLNPSQRSIRSTDNLFDTAINQSFLLTQPSVDCINLMKNDPSTVNITENLVTCSQYIEVKQEIHIKTELNRQSQSDDNFSDDTLNEIFKQADEHLVDKVHNQSPVEVLNKKSQNISRFPETQAISEPVTIKTEIETERTSRTKDSKNLLKSLMNSELQNKCKLEEEATFKRIVSARPKLAPVITSIFREQGPFFGLTNKVRQLILKTKGIKELYDWQEECLNLRSIFERRNLIYALPTSGGKTLVAEILMLREILLRGLNVIFVLPYVSIVQEKIHDLMPFAMELGFLLEEYCAGKGSIPPVRRRKKNSIFICTIEKSQIMFDSLYENGRLNEIGLIVVDELHMIGDAQRGYNLETLLAKAVMQQEHRIQVVGMSATIANLNEVASFLEADVYTRDFRPVELKEYVKFGSDILSVNSKASSIADAFKVERSNIGDNYPPKLRQRDPDHLTALVLEVVPSSSCLIFCATKLNCEHVAILLSQTLPKELTNYLREQKKTIVECIRADGNGRICGTLLKTLPYGVAYHHSGLTNDERKHLEEGFRQNIISVICCTSTLAAGVNLPASRVIIRSPYIGPHFLTLSRYKQMIGRAGRAGKAESGESVMICEPKDHSKLTGLLCSKMDETISGFVQDQSGALFRTVVMNCVGNKFATTFGDLMLFFNRTLLKVQIDRMEKSLRQILLTSIEELLDEGALSLVPKSDGRRNLPLTIKLSCGEEKTFYSDDHLEVSKLGKAAVNAGLSLEEAKKLEKELKKAQINFVLTQYVHLMYIVTPDDIVNSCSPHYQNYNTIFMKLDQSVMHTASIIGMTEKTAMKLVMNPRFKEEEKYILDRFYITLMLYDLWNGMDIYDVGVKYKVNRGIVNKLMMSAATRAYCILKFCEVYDDFWAFKDLLEHFSKRLAYCCSNELMPLLELPAVRIGRAKLLYNAGYKTIEDISGVTPDQLVRTVKNVNIKQATKIIKAAKHLLMEQVETYRDKVLDIMDAMKVKPKNECERKSM